MSSEWSVGKSRQLLYCQWRYSVDVGTAFPRHWSHGQSTCLYAKSSQWQTQISTLCQPFDVRFLFREQGTLSISRASVISRVFVPYCAGLTNRWSRGTKTLGPRVGHDNQIWQSVHAQFPNSISRLFPGMECFCSRLVVRFVLRCLFFVFFFEIWKI